MVTAPRRPSDQPLGTILPDGAGSARPSRQIDRGYHADRGTARDAIDRAELDALTGGDADLAREVLGLFAGQCGAILPRLLDPSLVGGERADLAHTLKGSAAGVGAIRVRGLCDAIETRLRAGEVSAPTDDLAAAVDAALTEIARLS